MKNSETTEPIDHSVEDEQFMHKMVAPEEQRRGSYPRMKWVPGQYRWFESENVIDLWRYYSPAQRAVISQRLRLRQRY